MIEINYRRSMMAFLRTHGNGETTSRDKGIIQKEVFRPSPASAFNIRNWQNLVITLLPYSRFSIRHVPIFWYFDMLKSKY
jgi:hypothetical protein